MKRCKIYICKRSGENALWQELCLFNLSSIPRRLLGNILVTGHKYGLKIWETKGYHYLLEKDTIKPKSGILFWNYLGGMYGKILARHTVTFPAPEVFSNY